MRALWLLCLLACQVAGAATSVERVPDPRAFDGSHVADPDRIIDAAQARQLNEMLASLEQRTGVQVAVVALDSIGTDDVFQFAQSLFVRWGIGSRARDDGLLILLVKDQRTVRFHTGYGLEGVLPDVICQRIQQRFMVPLFREGRYGEGLVAGIAQVDRLVSDPGEAQQFARSAEADSRWRPFSIAALIVGLVTVLIGLLVKGLMLEDFYSRSRRFERDPRNALRVRVRTWLLMYAVVPALILLAWDQLPGGRSVLACLASGYVYLVATRLLRFFRLRRAVGAMAAKGQYTDIVELLQLERRYWLWMAVLFPLPWLFYWLFHRQQISRYRDHPRRCSRCEAPMRRLAEDQEDKRLSAAQQLEETLQSMSHDVWQCTSCKHFRVESFSGENTSFTRCPKCRARAFHQESSTVIEAPTFAARGRGEDIHVCKACGHRKIVSYSIARLQDDSTSSSGSSSRSGSSSGSSWGGGSSGGGGSSSRW